MNDDDTRPDAGLDAELRRLFADDRLTLPVSVDTEHAVLHGVRRRQRRRLTVAAASGVLAVAAVVFVAGALTGIGRAPGTVTAAATPSLAPSLTMTSASPTESPQELGPSGLDGLYLGMPTKQAYLSDDRSVIGSGRSGSCTVLSIVSTTPAPTVPTTLRAADSARLHTISVTISPKFGVVQIGGSADLRTPEGITIGATLDDVRQVYPQVMPLPVTSRYADQAVEVAVPAEQQKADYVFELSPGDTVAAIWLRSVIEPFCG